MPQKSLADPLAKLRKHLHLLACPVCFGMLRLVGDTGIDCAQCGRRYPIVDGLPVLIESRAIFKA